MATGRVLQFDHSRGYGFIAADDGGDDVFLHASMFDGDTNGLLPGVLVEFQIMAGDRGRKAFGVRLSNEECTADSSRVPSVLPAPEEEQPCRALSETKFKAEFTELLLNTLPEFTSAQILQVRRQILDFAGNRGWVVADPPETVTAAKPDAQSRLDPCSAAELAL